MILLCRLFSLPLLVKELTESSARWRTYGARFLFAVGLYALTALFLPKGFFSPSVPSSYAAFSYLGVGHEIFTRLVSLQAVGIALFLPAMMCGCITQEKERDSLVLLLLTELRPWQILLQKYLGGILPVLSFVLLGAPLMAAAYALGGLPPVKILEQSIGILLLVLQLGALTLLCSVWCRTTVGALTSSYFLGVLMYVGPPILIAGFYRGYLYREEIAFLFASPALMEITSDDPLLERLVALTPCLLSILVFLYLARLLFLRRAFVPPSNLLRRIFQRLDGFFHHVNRRVGGVMLLRERSLLPGDAPIFWRETRVRALGRTHYLLRMLIVAEAVTVLFCIILALGQDYAFEALIAVIGMLSLLVVAVQAANVIVSERVNQTLEVLLTTPLAATRIIREKERALLRLLLVLAVPLITVFGVEYYLRSDGLTYGSSLNPAYLVVAFLAIGVYLPMVAWLAMTIGLWMRTRFRAIIVTLIVLAIWCVLPILVSEEVFQGADKYVSVLFSPLGALIFAHDEALLRASAIGSASMLVVLNFGSYGAIALGLRALLLSRADQWLRRG